MATTPQSLGALLTPLRDRVSLAVARHTNEPRSLRTRFAWIDVHVSPDDREDRLDEGDALTESLPALRDALTLLVTTLQHAHGRKSEWMTAFESLQLRESDIWDEIEERGELKVRVRIMGLDNLEDLRGLLLGLDDHHQQRMFEEVNPQRVRISEKVPLCIVVRAPAEAQQLGVEHTTTYLTTALKLVQYMKRGLVWTLQELELDFDHLRMESYTLPLLEELCQSATAVSSLRVRVPLAWTTTEIDRFLQILDQFSCVRDLTVRFDTATQLASIAETVGALTNVRSVELVHVTERHSRAHGTAAFYRQDVDLTAFFRPTTSAPLIPTLRCAEWSLHPVHVVSWFWVPLSLDHQSPVASLDLELDAMRIATLVAVLEHVGPGLRSLTLRGSSSSSSRGPLPSLPLDAFLTDCPQLEFLEIRGRVHVTSLSEVVARYTARETRIRSLAFVDVVFDDGLAPGLMTMVHELKNSDSEMTRLLRELRVEPVDILEHEPQLVNAIVDMLLVNNTLEMLILQNNRGVVPSALWHRIQSLHLRFTPTFYAFVSVVVSCQRDGNSQLSAISLLSRDALGTIFSFLQRPVRRKLRQRA